MKKKSLLLIFLPLISCTSRIDVEYIKSTDWQYSSGFRVTDYLTFDKTNYYSIKSDTLLVQGRPKAILVNLDKGKFDLKIRSLDGKMEGHYEDVKIMMR